MAKKKSEKVILKVPAEISRVQTMADGGLRLFVDTQELMAEDKGAVMAMHKEIGTFVFVPGDEEIAAQDLKDLPAYIHDKEEKSPSKRLRDRMFVFYKGTYNKTDGFDAWYISALDKIGQNYLDRLQ